MRSGPSYVPPVCPPLPLISRLSVSLCPRPMAGPVPRPEAGYVPETTVA
jgi:hypothetical protein